MLALTTLCNLGTQKCCRTLVVELNLDIPLLPLLQVADDATPLALALNSKSALVIGRLMWLEAEDLDTRTRRLVHNHAGTNHLRVIKDEQRTLRQLLREVCKAALLDVTSAVNKQF